MELALIVNGEEQNCFPLQDRILPSATDFNRASEMTAIDQAYMWLDSDPEAKVSILLRQERREYMDARFDITDLNEDERSALAGEVQAQAERNDDHAGVEVELEWNTVTE